jgi:hypothetical protein
MESSLAEHRQQQPRRGDRPQPYEVGGKASILKSSSSPERSGQTVNVIELDHFPVLFTADW